MDQSRRQVALVATLSLHHFQSGGRRRTDSGANFVEQDGQVVLAQVEHCLQLDPVVEQNILAALEALLFRGILNIPVRHYLDQKSRGENGYGRATPVISAGVDVC